MAFKDAVWEAWLEDGFKFNFGHRWNRDALRDAAEFAAFGVDSSRLGAVFKIPDDDFQAATVRARHFGDGFLSSDDEIIVVEFRAENDCKIFIRRLIEMSVDFANRNRFDVRRKTMDSAEIGGIAIRREGDLPVGGSDGGRRSEHVRDRVAAVRNLQRECFGRFRVVIGIDV